MRFVAEQVGEGMRSQGDGPFLCKYGHFFMTLRFYRALDTQHCAKSTSKASAAGPALPRTRLRGSF